MAPRPPLRSPEPARQPDYAEQPAPGLRDLAIGLPDPALLPDLGATLRRVDLEHKLRMSDLDNGDPELLELGAAAFTADGIAAATLAVVSGAFDGLERVLQAHLRPGDRVIIEDPAYTSIRDLLLALGLLAVPVSIDEYGLLPKTLRAALAEGAEAMVIVPRAQNPFGAAMDSERAAALRRELEPYPDLLLVEDDHTGAISGVPCTTLTSPERNRWAVIRSVSKVLHPDLRLALMAGDELTIARIEGRQALGPRWVSHILQATVVELLKDPDFPATTTRAREVYSARRRALIDALAERGLTGHGRSGLNVWVPVREEAPVIRALYEAGFIVLAGERFRMQTPPGLRITTSTMNEDEAPAVAAVIADAEGAGRPRRQY